MVDVLGLEVSRAGGRAVRVVGDRSIVVDPTADRVADIADVVLDRRGATVGGRSTALAAGRSIEVEGVALSAVAADDGVGYVFETGGVRVYHAGRTGVRAEHFEVDCRLAFLPVSAGLGMDVQEAVEASGRLRPEVVVPLFEEAADAEEFALLARCRVVILP